MRNNGSERCCDKTLIIDFSILILTLLYYFIVQFGINAENFSEDSYKPLWLYFTLECSIEALSQSLLILVIKKKPSKDQQLKLRGCTLCCFLLCSVLQIVHGLFSVWLLLQFSITAGLHCHVFFKDLKDNQVIGYTQLQDIPETPVIAG